MNACAAGIQGGPQPDGDRHAFRAALNRVCAYRRTGFTVASGAGTGAVTLIQRFGSALNLNIHFHRLFLDGVYDFKRRRPTFHRAPRPTPAELAKLLHTIGQRVARLLARLGLLVRDADNDYLDFEPGEAFDRLVGASIHYRIAIGPNGCL